MSKSGCNGAEQKELQKEVIIYPKILLGEDM